MSGELRVACLPATPLTSFLVSLTALISRFLSLSKDRAPSPPSGRGQRPGARLLLSQALGPGYLGVRRVELVCPSPHIPIPFNKVPGRCFLGRGLVGDTRGLCLALVPSYQGRAAWSLKEGRQRAHRPVSFGPNTLLCVLKIVAIHIQKKKYFLYKRRVFGWNTLCIWNNYFSYSVKF